MAFKNALKMLVSKFGYVWILLLYILITGAIVTGLGLPFAVPVVRAFRSGGVGSALSGFFSCITEGESAEVCFDKLYAVVQAMKNAVRSSRATAVNTGLLVFLVVIFAYRFIIGLYEIPLCKVLEGAMSSNARIGFTGRFIACIGRSSCFVLAKMLYTIVFDFIISMVVYGLFGLFNVSVLRYFAPFIIMLAVLVLLAFRYTFLAMWAPDIAVRDSGIFRAFGFSVRKTIRHIASVFSTYICAWVIIVAINMLVGIFTFGAGLILTVPLSLLFVNLLNMTVYYGKNGRRYYVDDTTVVTPPISLAEEK